MRELSAAAKNLLFVVAHAIAVLEPGLALGNGTLKGLLQRYDKESIVSHLAIRVEDYSRNNALTVRPAGPQLLHGYVQGRNIAIVACSVNTPQGEVQNIGPVLRGRAWFLTDAGLLPAHFNHMPEEAMQYIKQSNDL